MAKSRDKRGREDKKKKKPKKQALPLASGTDVHFRHHAVVATPEPPKPVE
jgi:hypothetical protein